MNRDQKIAKLLAQEADDKRRLALDELDEQARRSNTFGSKDHRQKRDETEKTYDDARRVFESYSEDRLDEELARKADA